MALKVDREWRSHKVRWKSGHLYQIGRYTNWFEDAAPLIIVLYRIRGIHPSSGHQWNLVQGINLNYVPRHVRTNFIQNWKLEMEQNNGNVFLTWERIKRQFPGIAKSNAIRRYQLKPTYMIQDVRPIPPEEMENAVVSSWHKDFMKKTKMALTRKYREAQKKRQKRTDDKGIGKILRSIFGRRR